jgi:uroporphyrinogen III methyltransferase/synthase
VAFITGHEDPAKPESALDWSALAKFPGTLAIYMGFARLREIVRQLIEHGKDRETPAAVVRLASTGDQRTVQATLRELPGAVQSAGLTAPAIVLIGPVVAMRARLGWFEERPLFGKRVIVTRPRHQVAELVQELENLGAVPFPAPALDIQDPPDWCVVDQAVIRLRDYDWLIFTSANGVEAFMRRLRHCGQDVRALGALRLAAIGPVTANALRNYYLEPDLVPDEFRSESLAAALRKEVAGKRVLIARADRGRDVLRHELGCVAKVDQIAVYRQVDAMHPKAEAFEHLRRGQIDFVTLTSSNIARAFIGACDLPCRERLLSGETKLASISPVTSDAIREMGFPVAVEALEYTALGLLQAMVRFSGNIAEGVPSQVDKHAAGHHDDDIHDRVDAASERDAENQVQEEEEK